MGHLCRNSLPRTSPLPDCLTGLLHFGFPADDPFLEGSVFPPVHSSQAQLQAISGAPAKNRSVRSVPSA